MNSGRSIWTGSRETFLKSNPLYCIEMPFLKLEHYRGQLCDSHLSYEFIPKEEHHLNLLQIGTALEKIGKQLQIKTPFILVSKVNGVKVSFYSTGKILTQNVPDEATANSVFRTFLEWINACMG